jgi:hypothetical protein
VLGWYLLLILHRRNVRYKKTVYAMNQHQKKRFLEQKFRLSDPLRLKGE